jgi:hypothetical protein
MRNMAGAMHPKQAAKQATSHRASATRRTILVLVTGGAGPPRERALGLAKAYGRAT